MSISRDPAGGVYGNFTTGQTLTWSQTVTGPSPILWVWGRHDNATATLSATYNGVAMTQVAFYDPGGGTRYWLWSITGITGTHNVVITSTVNTSTIVGASDPFIGALQSSSGVSGGQSASGSTVSNTLTIPSTENGSWMIVGSQDQTGGNPSGAGGSVMDVLSGSGGIASQGPYNTGSQTIQMAPNAGHLSDFIYASFAPAVYDIAVDATASVNGAGDPSPLNFNHTCTGSDGALVVLVEATTDSVTGVTYNSVAMSQTDKITVSGTVTLYAFLLIGPATGTHQISISYTGTPTVDGASISYTGCKQTGQPDAHATNSSSAATPTDVPLTTVADNCWIVLNCRDTNDDTLTASTNATERVGSHPYWKSFDTNGPQTPAGAKTMTISHGAAVSLKSLILSLAPVVASAGARVPYQPQYAQAPVMAQ